MTLCVYALTGPRPLRTPVRGLGGESLRLVTAGALAAIVGEVARAPRPTVTNLRRYDDILHRLAGERPALLPARFGTCVSAPDELRLVLRSRQQTLRTALAAVRHRAQMTVRVVSPGRRNRRGANAGAERADSLAPVGGPGSRYLRSRAAEAARERNIPGFDTVRAAVRRWVRAERVDRRAEVASVYHLVPRGSAAAYRRAAERAAAESGLRVVVTGPWPPYAFGGL